MEVDLHHELLTPSRLPLLRAFERLLDARPVEEEGSLLTLVGAVLGSLGGAGFTRVDHWEVAPGGWLPLPERSHASLAEPLAHLVRALEAPEWAELSRADRFSVRLSGTSDRRADVVVRRAHREREHTISLELAGQWRSNHVRSLVAHMRRDLPVLRVQIWEASPP